MSDIIAWVGIAAIPIICTIICKRIWHPGMPLDRIGMGYFPGDEWHPTIIFSVIGIVGWIWLISKVQP